jgi:DNA-directed RNA polymerase specialized sigma24 family protein
MTEFDDELSIRAERFGRTGNRDDWDFFCRIIMDPKHEFGKKVAGVVVGLESKLRFSIHGTDDLIAIVAAEIIPAMAKSYDRSASPFSAYVFRYLRDRLKVHIKKTYAVTGKKLVTDKNGKRSLKDVFAQWAGPVEDADGNKTDPLDLVPLDASDQSDRVHAQDTLSKIDPEQLAVLVMKFADEGSDAEIAKAVGSTKRAIEVLIDDLVTDLKTRFNRPGDR